MAPVEAVLAMDNEWSSVAIAVMISSLVLASLILLIVACGCCQTKSKDRDLYYSIDPNHPDYCPECAYYATTEVGQAPGTSMYGGEGQSMYDDGMDKRGAKSMGPGLSEGGSKPSRTGPSRDKRADSVSRQQKLENVDVAASKRANPADDRYKTLFLAKSDVFSKALGAKARGFAPAAAAAPAAGHGETQMVAAQRNPAYKTLFGAQSNVFDLPGGAGAGRGQQGRPQQMSVAAPENEARMRAAAKNPAYKTLFEAQSNVFDVPAKKGRGPPATSMDLR